MNTRIVRALLWEQFRKTYILWLCAFGIILLGWLLAIVVVQMEVSAAAGNSMRVLALQRAMEDASDVLWHSLCLALILYVACTLCIQDGMGELQFLMPVHQLRRPVSTFVLVLCRYFYDVLSAGVLVLGSWSLYELTLPHGVTEELDLWQILLGTLAITAGVRTLAWTLGGLGLLTVMLLGMLLSKGMLLGLEVSLEWATMTAVLSGFAISWMAVARQRSSRHPTWAPLLAMIDTRSVRPQKWDAPFGTPHAAMLWFERSRQAYIYPCVIFILYLAYFGPLALYTAHRNYIGLQLDRITNRAVQADALLLGLLWATLAATVVAGGLLTFMNQRTYVAPASRFLYLRPISTLALARARLQSTATRALVALLPLAILGLIVHQIELSSTEDTLLSGLLPQFGVAGALLVLALAFLGTAGLAWSGLWLGNVLVVAWTFVVCAFTVFQMDMSRELETKLVILLISIILLPSMSFIMRRCWKRGLLGRKDIAQLLLVGLLLVLAYWTLGNFESLESGRWAKQDWSWSEETPIGIAILGLMVALSLAPRLTVPLIMDWARHR